MYLQDVEFDRAGIAYTALSQAWSESIVYFIRWRQRPKTFRLIDIENHSDVVHKDHIGEEAAVDEASGLKQLFVLCVPSKSCLSLQSHLCYPPTRA